MRRFRVTATAALLILLSVLGALLLGSALWIRHMFGPVSVDQMLMHLPGVGGAAMTGAESGYVGSYLSRAVILPLLAISPVVVLIAVQTRGRLTQTGRAVPFRKRALSALRVRKWLPSAVGLSVLVVGGALFAQTINLPAYIRSFDPAASDFAEYYVSPMTGDPKQGIVVGNKTADGPLNLVVIYLESSEDAFGDDTLFEINMNEPLELATESWARFDELSKYEGGGWTMAGIVGTECGLPLRAPGLPDDRGKEIGEGSEGYLPGIDCLGDVLNSQGYYNLFMGGADAEFASKGKYLETHGYDEVLDLNYWLSEGETETSLWGLSDRRLMANAKDVVTRLHQGTTPFLLSVLTVDSHEPATLFESCPLQTEEPLASVIHCSMGEVADFIRYMESRGYLEDTVVFITGDHPKQFGEIGIFMEELSTLDAHPLFNRLWVPGGVEIKRTELDQLSVSATLLDALGLGRADGRSGLGYSALREVGRTSGAVALPEDEYLKLLQSRSGAFMRDVWSQEPGFFAAAGELRRG